MTTVHADLVAEQRGDRVGDKVAAVATIVGLLALTGVPYAFAYATCPADKQFMGILLNVPDTAQYLSWAREASRALLVENKLTPEQGDAVFFNLFWLVVGRLAPSLGLDYAPTLQVVRPLAGAAYLAAIYWFICLVVQVRLARWVAFLVIVLGSGLGWTLVVAKQITGELAFPMDLYVSETNTFLTIMAFPFAALAGGLLVLVLGLSALAFEKGSYRYATAAGLLTLALGLQHGYDLIIVYAVVGSLGLLVGRQTGLWWRALSLTASIFVWSAPALLYVAYLAVGNSTWKGVLAQYGNAGVFTPPPAHLLILLGLPLILILVTPGANACRQCEPRSSLVKCWLVVGFLLLYLPTNFQIKMLSGWQVPVGIVATWVLTEHLAPQNKLKGWPGGRRARAWLGVAFVALVVPTNLYLFAWRFVDLNRHDYPYYLHVDEAAALRWLEDNSAPSEVVLSSLTIGQYVPSVSGNRAFLAHWAQTLDFYGKQDMVARYFAVSTSDEDRRAMLERYGVRYVFHGEQERALGGFQPDRSSDLRKAFAQGDVAVYRVSGLNQSLGASR